jgi:hypothetical protein
MARSRVYSFKLRFPAADIQSWANEYGNPDEDRFLGGILERVSQQGYYSQEDFAALCRWKTPRSKRLVAENTADTIRRLTGAALSSRDEEHRVESLLSLRGIAWPTASVLLHVGTGYQYPILDFRALWSLGYEETPTYNAEFWAAYTKYCREIAAQNGVSLRTFDRALWAYSKRHQGKRGQNNDAAQSPRVSTLSNDTNQLSQPTNRSTAERPGLLVRLLGYLHQQAERRERERRKK